MNVHEIMRRGSLVEPLAARLLPTLTARQQKRLMNSLLIEKPLIVSPAFICEALLDSLPKNHNQSAKAG